MNAKKKIIILFLFFCVFCGAFNVNAARWQVRVKKVFDGDTVVLMTGETVRLQGIDAPEIGHDGEKDQYFAREAKSFLERLVRGRTLTIETRELSADRFGRILAYLYISDRECVNEMMVANGMAFCFPHKGQDEEKMARLLSVQRSAMNGLRGFWARILSMKAARDRYVGNKKSKRFHTMQCGFGRRIYYKNKILFSSLREAFYAGFAPCRKCTVWPRVSGVR